MSEEPKVHALVSGAFEVEILDPRARLHLTRFDRSGVVSRVRLHGTDFMSAEYSNEAKAARMKWEKYSEYIHDAKTHADGQIAFAAWT